MYAIIEIGGRQQRVEPGSRLQVNRVDTAVGSTLSVERVLLAHDGLSMQVGRPYLADAKVVCEVLEHRLGPKVISYHYRRRENWRKTVGHRQRLTRLEVKEIVCPGAAAAQASRETMPSAAKATGTKTRARTVTPKAPTLKAARTKSPQAK